MEAQAWNPALGRQPRALVVEDASSIRTLLSILLRRQGFEVVLVDHGDDAVAAARDQIDIVLLDIGLPGIDGLEVCRRIRADPATSDIGIVLVTGRVFPDDIRRGLDAGANGVLAKPFTAAELNVELERDAVRHRVEVLRTRR